MSNPHYTPTAQPASFSRGRSQTIRDEYGLIEAGFDSVEAAIQLLAPKASPTFTGTVTMTGATVHVATQAVSDDSTKAASTAFVHDVVGASGTMLPVQTTHAGKFLKTDGTSASWENAIRQLGIFSSEAASADAISTLETVHDASGSPGIGALAGLSYNGSILIAYPISSSNSVASSTDGETWVARTMPSSAAWTTSSDGTNFVACVNAATTVATSSDGITWSTATALPGAATALPGAMAGGGGRVVVRGGASVTTLYLTTNAGSSWSTETAPVSSMNNIFYCGLFVGMASTTNTYYTSTTGTTGSWTSRTLPSTCDTITMNYDGSLVAFKFGDASVNFHTSTDGINWTNTGLKPFVSANASMLTVNGIALQGTSTSGQFATRHNGRWVARTSQLSTPNGAAKTVAKIGSVHASVGGTLSIVLLIDSSSSTTAYFGA